VWRIAPHSKNVILGYLISKNLCHEVYFLGLDTNPFKELGWLGCQDLTLV
jgi:hypothetical protein